MNKNKSIKKNFVYSFLLNVINILFPLITSPYVSRVLGADNLGKYSFSLSLSNWFLVFATFGTTTYGIREIAKVRDNKKLLNKKFSEIFSINFIATSITLVIYLVAICISPKTNAELLLFLVSALSIFFNLFCIDWLYMGLEDFKVITLRSLLIKMICLVSMFIFIKQKNDYVIYALISVLAFGFANVLNFMYSKKFIKLRFKNINLRHHMGNLSVFFYSSIVVSMYTLFDQVFLGFFAASKDLAFYSRSRQIYSIALSITLSISTILLPKLAYLYENDFQNYKRVLKKSIDYVYIFSVPSVLGLIILSKDIMWFFGGKEFEGAYISLIILSILVFTVSLGTWQYNQLFVPVGREKIGLKVQIFIAVSSISTNILLVPKFGYIGASLSLAFSEIIGTIYGVYYAKNKIKEVKIIYITKSLLKYIFASIIMLLIIIVFKRFKLGYAINIIFGAVIGGTIYFGTLYLIKEDICKELANYVISKITRTYSKRKM